MGPLHGVKILELGGIGPGPFAGMLLSDLGAEVVRIDRAQAAGKMHGTDPVTGRGRRAIAVDLKHPDGVEAVLRLVERADSLIDPFRPGVLERLGIGPDVCQARNPRLVFAQMTGWGQDGPLAHAAGHDINYIALAGALAHFGREGVKPTPPINMVGDYGGGGMLLAFGVVCAILEARTSGVGQVIDAAMVDGSATLMAAIWGMSATGVWREELGTNIIDTGAPFYDTYETKDGKFVSIGAVEPQFFALLLELTGFTAHPSEVRSDRDTWHGVRDDYVELFKSKTRDEWCELLEGTDACFAPVLPMSEAAKHPHIADRETIVELEGVLQPAPSPRFSRTPGAIQGAAEAAGAHTEATLADWGFSSDEIRSLLDAKAIVQV
jgi:alpha-methylacyl-CoA racemase